MPSDIKTWSIGEIATQQRATDVWIWKDLGVHPAKGKPSDPVVAMACMSILACVRVISETVASLPIEVYRIDDRSKKRARKHPLYRLLNVSPSPNVTAFSWVETLVAWVCVWGNAYCEIVRSRGVVLRLVPMHPSRMRVEETAEGVIRYAYDNPNTGKDEFFTPDQILHFKWLSNDGGLTGMVPAELMSEAIELARACDLRAIATAKNGASPSIVLETENSVPEPVQEKLRDQWRQIYGGVMNAGKTAILPNGLKAHELGRSNRDNELNATRESQLREIARIYRVPPSQLGLSGGAPQRNPEIAGIELLRSCAGPWILRLEKEIELKLFDEDDEHTPEFDVRAILRTDSASRSRMMTTEIQLGLATINEGRVSEGRPPVEGGDTVLLSHNFNTLEALLAAAEAAAKQAANPPQGGPEGAIPGLPGRRQPPGRRTPGKNAPDDPDPAGQQVLSGGVASAAKKAKRLSKRALNPCGQEGDGTFDTGNTCAAGDGSSSGSGEKSEKSEKSDKSDKSAKVAASKAARAAKEEAIKRKAGRESGHTGDALAAAAHKHIFEAGGHPGDLLKSVGWLGSDDDRTILEADIERASKSLTDNQKKALSASIAGIAAAMKQFPLTSDVSVRVSTVAEEKEKVERDFRDMHEILLKDKSWSKEKFDEELAKEIDASGAGGVAGYYKPHEDTITIVADVVSSADDAKTRYVSKVLSSPSQLHTGFHETVHAAHWKAVRNRNSLPPNGALNQEQFRKVVMSMNVYAEDASVLLAIIGEKRIADTVSKYATTNERELAAEYVTGVALGGVKRDPELDSVMDLLHAPAAKPPKVTGEKTIGLREILRS
jgi:HK97 family phage portal protein